MSTDADAAEADVEVSEVSPFTDAAQHDRANQLGLWTFLATEILFFGGLFVSYTVYRISYPTEFAAGSRLLELDIGAINTAVLLTSSLCVALGEHCIKRGERRALMWWIIAAWVLGALFLGLKGYEYSQKFHEHLVPGRHFALTVPGAPQIQLFLVLYFAMTGLHVVHMVAGLSALGWLLWQNHRNRLDAEHHQSAVMVALYWHFVDCVWVFLFALLYLVSPS